MKGIKLLLVFVFSLLIVSHSYAQGRMGLDLSFADSGILRTMHPSSVGNGGDDFWGAAIQPDGKIVTITAPLVSRYWPNGKIDSSFGRHGRFDGVLPVVNVSPANVYILNDGKILLTGRCGDIIDSFLAVRLKPNGMLDSSFGNNGTSAGFLGHPSCSAMQADGKIVIAGDVYYNRTALVRLNANGTIDSSFGTNGYVNSAGINGEFGIIRGIEVMSDGRIILGGDGIAPGNIGSVVTLRYLPNGKLDTTFNHVGYRHIFISSLSYGHDLKLQPDGKVLMAGYAGANGFIYRLDTAGNIDQTFGQSGIIRFPPTDIRHLLILQNGKLLVAGNDDSGFTETWVLMRVLPDGSSLDSSFGRNGIVKTEAVRTQRSRMFQVLEQPDQKILAVGMTSASGFDDYATMIRYMPNAPTAVRIIGKTDFKIYPNPVSDKLTIMFRTMPEKGTLINIYSMDGRLLQSVPATGITSSLNLADVPRGYYNLTVQFNQFTQTKHLLKL